MNFNQTNHYILNINVIYNDKLEKRVERVYGKARCQIKSEIFII